MPKEIEDYTLNEILDLELEYFDDPVVLELVAAVKTAIIYERLECNKCEEEDDPIPAPIAPPNYARGKRLAKRAAAGR